MAAPRPWTVHHPRPLTQRSPSLWTVDDDVPGLPGADRRMSVIRRSDGSLVFFNAIPLPEAALEQVKALGTPAHLLLPNHFHALDAAAFAERLGVTAWAPDVAVPVLRERVACQPISAFPSGPDLRLFAVDGFATKELVLVARETLFTADLVTNSPHGAGVMGLVMRLIGFTGPSPKLPKPVRRRVQRDREAVKALLLELAALPGLTRLVPSHGTIVEGDVGAVLRQVAAEI
ncbi:MAG: hypothetical protein GQE15_14515 [Archangiaceae bacterium]|nr:hypothetical protein [Archangiaceae bacterium]